MRVSILFCSLLIGCYLATISASSDDDCPSNERLVECCNNAPREKRWGFGPLKGAPRVRRRRNFRIIRLRMYRNRISARFHLRILQRQRRRRLLLVNFRVKLRHCRRRYNIRRRNWQNRVFWSMMRGRANFARSRRHVNWMRRRFEVCRRRATFTYRRLVRLAHRRRYRRRRGCCCRAGNRRSENTNTKNDDEDEKKNEGEEKKDDEDDDEDVQPEDENEAEEESKEAEEEKGEEQEKPKDCKTTSGNCCSALEALGDDTKADDNLANDVKALFENLVSKISEADEDTDVVTLENVFEDYIELSQCSSKKGVSVDTKNDLAEMLNMESPKLTLELFGNPQSYDEEMEFILENVDDSVFGKEAYFCQEDKCEKYGKGEADSKLKGEVELFVPPNVKVKGSKRTYLPTAAYTLDKQDGDKFTVEEGEKDTPKVIVDLEKESYSLAKDEKVSDLQTPSQVCVSKKVKAELKSKGGEWTLDGEICATSVDEVTDIKVNTSDEDDEDMYVFDISKEGTALPLQMKEFNNQKNTELLEKYKKFLGDSNKEELAIQYAKFPKDEAICFGNGSVKQKTNEVPTDPPLDVVKCKESGNDKSEEEKKKDEAKKGEKKHRINRNHNRYWRKQQVMNE
ncbi:uncharacterized protein [Clytia hemisphaerica]|uniref:Cnidarian restricted protein n=1 Tax=Clytia hemisphaerica TaxID=252671 RepID=A0A7M5URQ9_9CNID